MEETLKTLRTTYSHYHRNEMMRIKRRLKLSTDLSEHSIDHVMGSLFELVQNFENLLTDPSTYKQQDYAKGHPYFDLDQSTEEEKARVRSNSVG